MTLDGPQSLQVTKKRLTVADRLREMSLGKAVSSILVIIALGVAILSFVREGSDLLRQPIQLNIPLVLLSLLIASSGLLIAIHTWRRILAGYGVRQPIRHDLRIYSYSALGLILPGGIWAIVGRSAFYRRLGVSGLRIATASVVETFVIGVAAMGVYAVSVIVRPDLSFWQRPEIGLGFSLLVLLLIHPRVFNRLSGWMLRRSKRGEAILLVEFGLAELVGWICLESVVVLIGGLAWFVLLTSLIAVPGTVLVQMISAWAAALAVGSLFFWLPGTAFLRDGAMIVALTPSLPMSVAVIFVLIVRIWSIASLLIIAGAVWLLLDRPHRAARGGDSPPLS
ncbi:MAG TPA: hypothetical protein VFL17_21480 [Anaerolineae bacterium]|nr:hypothetical protein [Anaerolineae bacterium]